MQDLSIYIHWPFCKSKCPYCDFMSIPEHNEDRYREIEDLLLIDLKNSMDELENPFVKTIFFGGGTPSLMSTKFLEKIIDFITKKYKTDRNLEISLEANPATFSSQKIKEIKKAGVNRLSLGIQSFLDKNLRFLGRIYNAFQAVKAADMVANLFSNYSFDFIYGYQNQSIKDIEYDLNMAKKFHCPHVSCYQLTFEENTPFFYLLKKGDISTISENQEIKIFQHINAFLNTLNRYEISNYSLKNFESKHNLAYWRYQNFLGVGPSAHSRLIFGKQRYELKKIPDINKWKSRLSENLSTYEERKSLTKFEQLEEIFIMGLRLSEGVSLKRLESEFSESLLQPIFKKINTISDTNLFKQSKTHIKLSENGLIKQNSIIKFLFD